MRDATGALVDFQRTHRFRHTKATSLLNAGVPLHVVQRYLGHLSPEMTMIYAKTLASTHEAEFLRYRKLTADARELDTDPRDLYDMLQLDKRTDRFLANGWCLLPPRQHCSKGNACLTCDKFATDATFLPELTTQLTRTEQLIGERCQTFKARTGQEMSEDNVCSPGAVRSKTPSARSSSSSSRPGSLMAASRPCAALAPPHAPTRWPTGAARRDSAMRGNPGNLRRAAAAKSAAAQARAENGLEQMLRRGDPITFRGLAQTACVSLDFLYRTPGIRAGSNSSGPAAGHAHRARATPRTGPAEQRDPDAHHPAHRAQTPSPRRNQCARRRWRAAHGENLELRRRLGRQDTTAPLS